jgi:hypothetical protein
VDVAARSSAGAGDAQVLVPRPGTATGVGSLSGDDPLAAQRLVFDLLPDLPHLVELPDRGPGADLVGRTAAFLTELPVDLQPSGWRFVQRAGHDLRRARDLLDRDLDALAEVASDYTGPLKVQAAGPWTLAATIELTRGDKALQDAGAVADIAASLADGLAGHVAAVRRACPGAEVVVQLDEPALPAVRLGHVPTVSGFSVLRTPETPELQGILGGVLAALPHAGVHCCAPAVPVALLRESGARWVGVDATLLTSRDDDGLGEAYEAGLAVVLGLAGDLTPATALFRRLGLGTEAWLAQTAVSPPCGMATAQTYRRLTELAKQLAETIAP